MQFKHYAAAAAYLNRRGMVYSHRDGIQNRDYYRFPTSSGRVNVVSDHSATITRIDGAWYVADYSA